MTASPLFRKQLQVDGKVLELRPNFACYCAIEERAKDSLMKIIYRFSKGELLIKDVVAVVWGGLIGTAEELSEKAPYTYEELGNLLVKDGWSKHSKDVLEFASRCIMGYGQAVTEQEKEEAEAVKTVKKTVLPETP